MRIKSVEISSFRSIKKEKLYFNRYNVLIGPNNSGKSNVIAALLYFFDEIPLKDSDFYCCPENSAKDLYVEVEYSDMLGEIFDSLPDFYKLPEGRLKVRRMAQKGSKGKGVYRGYILEDDEEKISEHDFFGAKGVGKGKIGNVIYIPALKPISDELKTTGSATLAKLLKEIIDPSILESTEYQAFENSVKKLSARLRGAASKDSGEWTYTCTSEIEGFLNKDLADWDCSVNLDLVPLEPYKLAQQAATLTLIQGNHVALPVESHGHGLQRSLEFALINLWAKILGIREKQKDTNTKKKTFKPEFTLLLIEEPETFQHPQQQLKFFGDLCEISNIDSQQAIATSHSPFYLSAHIDDLSKVIKIVKNNNESKATYLSNSFIQKFKQEQQDRNFRYSLWLNPDRNTLFFSDLVILVEGQTDKILFNWLLENGDGAELKHRQKCFVIDCGGKFKMDLFMNLLGEYQIPHVVVHDKDNEDKEFHKEANERIQRHKNAFTKQVKVIDPDLEKYLGVPISKKQDNDKPVILLEYLDDKENRNDTVLQELFGLITKNLSLGK